LGSSEVSCSDTRRGRAFTGAIAQKTGRFELASTGTLFIDEVGDIPLELQAKLLRVLQEQEFERLGSNRTHKVDVRLIAATHCDLPDALARYRWPGNVRELQIFIERAVILSPHTVLRAPTSELEPFSAHKSPNMIMTGLEEVERDHIVRALEASNWVVGGRSGAAERLGMKRTSLVYKMQKLRIIRPASQQESRVHQV
jgi:transcriptional regulator with GAF, ATPase, and Fis domain